jgi:D-aminopeptidase
MVAWLLDRPGMEDVRSINPIVGETNDGGLNDIRSRPIAPQDVVAALESAAAGPVAEGAVGAGRGTSAFGWKGGIGTSSRVTPGDTAYTVGVLVQSNFGGILTINGAPVGRELGRYSFRGVRGGEDDDSDPTPDGSIMMVVATDAPIDSRNLERLAHRALVGLARTGATMSNGSGDYVIAFSTAGSVRRTPARTRTVEDLSNDAITPLFQAVAEATEEAVYNSLFRAVSVTGPRGTTDALPIEQTLEVLRKYGVLYLDRGIGR